MDDIDGHQDGLAFSQAAASSSSSMGSSTDKGQTSRSGSDAANLDENGNKMTFEMLNHLRTLCSAKVILGIFYFFLSYFKRLHTFQQIEEQNR